MIRKLEDSNPENTHILLKLPESFLDEAIEILVKDVDEKGIYTAVMRRPDFVAYAAFEWSMDGVITALLLKTLFDGFMKEAGKDGYIIIKAWLKKVATDARLIKVKLVTARQSTEKLNSSYTQSLSITPQIQLKKGNFVKLLFDERLNNKEWELAIERIFDMIKDHYENYPEDHLTKVIAELTTKPHQRIYAMIDIESKEWLFLNDTMLIEIDKRKAS